MANNPSPLPIPDDPSSGAPPPPGPKSEEYQESKAAIELIFPVVALVVVPIFVMSLWSVCAPLEDLTFQPPFVLIDYKCNILQPLIDVISQKYSLSYLWNHTLGHALSSGYWFSPTAWISYSIYIFVQFILYYILPGETVLGQSTPEGNRWKYKMNGLFASIVSLSMYIVGAYYFKLYKASIIIDNLFPLLGCAQAFGIFLTVFCYFKAWFAPSIGPETHRADVKFTNNVLADLYKGVELNPRLGFNQEFDIKTFVIVRIGMIGWAFVNLSAVLTFYERHGTWSNSLILINVLHAFYIFDLLIREAWYLETIDIMLDRSGFYILYGCTSWLPILYCLQSFWLLRNPVQLSWIWIVVTLSLCVIGYIMFLDSNWQRTQFRKDLSERGESKVTVGYLGNRVFCRKPQYVMANWIAKDGSPRKSALLASGYWGIARHFNYCTDLLMCFAFGMTCGSLPLTLDVVMPYVYFIYMVILLSHRAIRDERRMRQKYGHDYELYVKLVPYSMIPGVF